MTSLVVVVSGALFGLGVVGTVLGWERSGGPPGATWLAHAARRHRGELPLVALALVVAGGAYLVTGWPVAVPVTALGVLGLPRLFGRTAGSVSILKIEAIAGWTEMLQSTMAASAGLSQAIVSTAPLSPLPIRPATLHLSTRLGAGMHPRDALELFAEELGDSCSDRVVCALQLAATAPAQRLGELLSVLADSTRQEVSQRLRIETSRASLRSGVRTVVVFSLVFAVLLALLARTYLAPFGTRQGQVVLVVIAALYGAGLTLMVSLARPPAPTRLLGSQVVER
jgi:tight adherence protein B